MWEVIFNLAAVICLYGAVEYCLRGQSGTELDEASLIPFADDPEVARRVELATGGQGRGDDAGDDRPGFAKACGEDEREQLRLVADFGQGNDCGRNEE